MGWIEKVKSIICGLKVPGKSEKEIEQIVQQAADKATVGGKTEVKPIPPLFGDEYMKQARYKARTESNNWRKMHGLPMRRKRRVRR